MIENDFFIYAVNNNKELADVLIKPLLNYLGISNYKIISVDSEVNYQNNIKHGIRVDCLVELVDGKRILIEIQNGNSNELPLKRIRFEQSLFDADFLEEGKPYTDLPEVISLVYTTEPLPNLDNGKPVADIVAYDVIDQKIVEDYGIRTVVVNGKYRMEGFEEFTDVIEDLQESDIEKIKNPIIKSIHSKTKNTERGRNMFSEYMKELFGDVLQENADLKEQLRLEQEQNRIVQEKNNKYEDFIKKMGYSLEDI